MKQIFYFLLFFLFLISTSILNAKENIVFIDLNYVLKKSNNGKKILEQLNSISEENKKKFNREETILEKERDDIKKLINIISKDEYNKKVASFQDKVELYNTKKTETIKSFENKKKKNLIFFLRI